MFTCLLCLEIKFHKISKVIHSFLNSLGSATRVDSFVVFLVSRDTKLYETGRCFAESRSFRETDKNTKKVFRVVSRNCETVFHFVLYFFF